MDPLHTIQRNYASRAGEDAHGADILLSERVLHTGHNRADGRGLKRRACRVRERIPRMEGGLLVGHGGRNGRQCRPESSLDVGEDGSDQLGEANALSRKQTTCIIGRHNLPTAVEEDEQAFCWSRGSAACAGSLCQTPSIVNKQLPEIDPIALAWRLHGKRSPDCRLQCSLRHFPSHSIRLTCNAPHVSNLHHNL
jgi:hypothetical protein